MHSFRNRLKPGMMNMRDFLNLPIMKIQNLTKMFETSSLFSVRVKKICNKLRTERGEHCVFR